MTGKFNRGTDRVFEGIEDDTQEIYNLDESNRDD